MTKYEIAIKLHRQILACKKCPDLWKPPISPQGNLSAKIFLCGRNPGRIEHRIGKPFAGDDGAPGGRLLNQELVRIGLPRSNCWITNLVCCYSDSDRPPTNQEIENCWPFMRVQLLLIKPKLVVAMGKQAADQFTGHGLVWKESHGVMRLGELEGTAFKYVLLPTTHPGQALRGKRDELYKDFNVVKGLVSGKILTELIEHPIRNVVGNIGDRE